jgi:hypothetical protein
MTHLLIRNAVLNVLLVVFVSLAIGFACGWYLHSPSILVETKAGMPTPSKASPNHQNPLSAQEDHRTSYVTGVCIKEGAEEVWNSLDHGQVAGCKCERYVLEFRPITVENNQMGEVYPTETVTVVISNVGTGLITTKTVQVSMGSTYQVPIVLERKALWHIELHDARGYFMLDVDNFNRDVNKGQFVHSVGWLSTYTVEAL